MKLLIAILLAFAAAGAGIGWVMGTRTLYEREYNPLDPPMLRRRVVIATVRRRKIRRVLLTLFYALLGMLAGFAFLMYLARR
ncbi:MAG TPA: hypothetical protein VFB13_06975 [Reyranella sp.]|nr:hypothetical protein [Reyranella sp.]